MSDAPAVTDEAHVALVRFNAGGIRFAVEARQVRAVRTLADPHGDPKVAIETVLGLPVEHESRRHVLVIGSGAVDFEVTVADPVELESLPARTFSPLPPLAAARISLVETKAIALASSGLVVIVDLEALMRRVGVAAPCQPAGEPAKGNHADTCCR